MQHKIGLFILCLVWSISAAAMADEKPGTEPSPEDIKVVAVLEILEQMEILDDIELFKDMEYLNEGDPNESQK